MNETELEPLSSKTVESEPPDTTVPRLESLVVLRVLDEQHVWNQDQIMTLAPVGATLSTQRVMHSSTVIDQTSSEPRSI